MFIYASICYIPFSYQDIAGIEWNSISTAAIYQVLYVVLCGSFIAYICIMTAQKLMRPTVVSMYNYVQPIVASIAAILMGIGSFGWEKGVAIALVRCVITHHRLHRFTQNDFNLLTTNNNYLCNLW